MEMMEMVEMVEMMEIVEITELLLVHLCAALVFFSISGDSAHLLLSADPGDPASTSPILLLYSVVRPAARLSPPPPHRGLSVSHGYNRVITWL